MTMGLTSPTSTTGQILKNGSAVISFDANNNATFSGNVAPTVNPTFRNRIINGAMVIDQRNAGASVSTSSGASVYTVDRWQVVYSQTSKFTVQQVSANANTTQGFDQSLRVTSSSAYSLGAGDYFQLQQYIEGLNIVDLAWGTASAKPITISFWAYSSLTGNFALFINNSAVNRVYPTTYTINSANTWTYCTVTIPGDTSGTWLTTNGTGIRLAFSLGEGSNYVGGGNAWNSGTYFQPAGCVNLVSNNAATLYITGVQLEAGSVATPFEQRLYGTELANCQRYYWELNPSNGGNETAYNISWYNTKSRISLMAPVPMRAAPTITFTGTASGAFFATNNDVAFTNFTFSSAYGITYNGSAVILSTTPDTASGGGILYIQNSRELTVSAEL
jgi:hypothetical protein